MISSFFKCEQLDPESIILLVDFLAESIPLQFDASALSNFMQKQSILSSVIKHISELIFVGQQDNAKLLQDVSKNSLLTPAALCLVYANLPEELRDRWKLLFSRFAIANLRLNFRKMQKSTTPTV